MDIEVEKIYEEKENPMKSTLIKDTTKSERIELIKQWQEPEDLG